MSLPAVRELAHYLMGAQQTGAIYPPDHPRVGAAVRDLYLFLRTRLSTDGRFRLARTGEGFVFGEEPCPTDGDLLGNLDTLMERQGIDRLVIEPGLQRWEARSLVATLIASEEKLAAAGGAQELLAGQGVRNVRVGKLQIADGPDRLGLATSLAQVWDLYNSGIAAVRRLRSGATNGLDPEALREARDFAERLSGATDEHGDAFLLLQALQKHDAYSYTHSVNVAMLTLSAIRYLGFPEHHWSDVALAALLHDIGKELVPNEVLNKPGKLTDEEWEVMQRHSSDGAQLLMSQSGVPELAVVVAYEHQLAYEHDNPDHGRWPLHLVSQTVCVADVYDALRSNRPYRAAIPPERALEIMQEEVEQKFDPALFGAFQEMVGQYPPGTLVELDDGGLAISLGHGDGPFDRPRVLLVRDGEGERLEPPLTLDLAQVPDPSPLHSREPEECGIDPFDYF